MVLILKIREVNPQIHSDSVTWIFLHEWFVIDSNSFLQRSSMRYLYEFYAKDSSNLESTTFVPYVLVNVCTGNIQTGFGSLDNTPKTFSESD
jgi:hypothetical protein